MFEIMPLQSVVDHQVGGGTPPRSDPSFWGGQIPWASVKDFSDDSLEIEQTQETISEAGLRASTANVVPPGVPLVCTRMAVGRVAVATRPTAINQDVRALFPKAQTDPRYLLRLLSSVKQRAESQAVGSTVKGIRTADYLALDVPVAPIAEQPVIAQILDTLDTQIRQTEALIAKLETLKQGLLTDLLTRGIDENGQLRSPHEEAPELYKDSPLGPIPMEWEIAFVGDLGEVVTGSTPPSSDPKAWGDAFPFFTPGDVIDYEPMQSAERAISDMGRRHIREIPGGSTLVVCIGSTIGKVGFTSRSGATNQQINAVLPSKAWDEFFVFQAIRTYVHQIHVWAGLQAVPIVNKSTFSQMLVPHPKLEEQRSISEKLRAVDRRIADEREAIRKLFEQKKGLMDDLLTGRVRVTPFIGTAKAAQTSRV